MAFLIPDNLKSHPDVPAGIRRVAGALQIGLDDDVTVWYEPPFDPTGEKPHLVVLLPDQGIVVLEVLDVEAGGFLGVLRGRLQIERDGKQIEADNPLLRANRLVGVLQERVMADPRLRGVRVPVVSGAALPNLTRGTAISKRLDHIIPLEKCLMRDEILLALSGEAEGTLLRTFAKMLQGNLVGDPITSDQEGILRGIIQPDLVINHTTHTSHNDQITVFRSTESDDDIVRVMDRRQEAMAKNIGSGHRVIRGVAGSGKTLILVYRARLLARMHPSWKILVTCYTRSLAGQLRELLRDTPNIEVMNIDRLMADAIRGARLKHPGYKEGDDAVAAVGVKAIERGAGSRYQAVLIDEAQDLGTDALRFAVGLLADGQDDLVVVADAAQNIFKKKFSWKQAGIQAQGRTRILRLNYRNTREILEFASDFLLSDKNLRADDAPDLDDEHVLIPPESAARSGPAPHLYVVDSVEDEVATVVEQVKDWVQDHKEPQSIAVLYGNTWERRNRAYLLYNALQELPGGAFWLTSPDRKSRDRLGEAKERIILATIHSAKGLEFPSVALCGIWKDSDDTDASRMLAYVGMTRAQERLTVVTIKGSPLAEDLVRVKEPSPSLITVPSA